MSDWIFWYLIAGVVSGILAIGLVLYLDLEIEEYGDCIVGTVLFWPITLIFIATVSVLAFFKVLSKYIKPKQGGQG